MNLDFPLKINESLKHPSLERFHGATSAPSPCCILMSRWSSCCCLCWARPGDRESPGESQRLFPAWGWDMAPKPHFMGKDPLVELRAGVFGWCDLPCGLPGWIVYGICGNLGIILYSASSNPAFCDLTYTQIFWVYTEFVLCNLVMVLNRLSVVWGSTYRSVFVYRN